MISAPGFWRVARVAVRFDRFLGSPGANGVPTVAKQIIVCLSVLNSAVSKQTKSHCRVSDEAIRDAQPESPSSVLCSPDCASSMDYPSLEMSEKKRVLGKD